MTRSSLMAVASVLKYAVSPTLAAQQNTPRLVTLRAAAKRRSSETAVWRALASSLRHRAARLHTPPRVVPHKVLVSSTRSHSLGCHSSSAARWERREPKARVVKYLLRLISLFIGVLRSNLPKTRPFPRVQCRPVPTPKPQAEALLTR